MYTQYILGMIEVQKVCFTTFKCLLVV